MPGCRVWRFDPARPWRQSHPTSGWARLHPGRIQLLLTDVVLPGMNGRALADQLTRLEPELRVLYVSGYTDDAIARQGVLEPGIRFLSKPYVHEALARKVREVLDEGRAK